MNISFFESGVFQLRPEHLWALSPFLALCAGAFFTTIAAGFKASLGIHRILLISFFGLFAFLNAWTMGNPSINIFGTSLFVDDALRWIGLGIGSVALVSALFVDEEEHLEWSTLILVSVLGLSLLPGARDWVAFFVYLETLAFPAYIMAAYRQHRDGGFEVGIKYLLMGAFSSAIFLMGLALVYGAVGSFDYAVIREVIVRGLPSTLLSIGSLLILISAAFKVALAPMHMWAADVYQSAPTALASYMSGGSKLALFSATLVAFAVSGFTALPLFSSFIFVFAVLSIVLGNLMAMTQKNIRRMLAYSSVASAGYAAFVWSLGESALPSLLIYLVTYGLAFAVAFAALDVMARSLGKPSTTTLEISDLKKVSASTKGFVLVLFALALFSMAGIPPLPGFVGKYMVLKDVWAAGFRAEAFWILGGSLLSLGYFLRLFVPVFFETDEDKSKELSPANQSLWPKLSMILGFALMFVWVALAGMR